MRVNLTKMQSEEIAHKLSIMADEPDLLDSYKVTEQAVREAYTALPTDGGTFECSPEIAEAVIGELENLMDIARGNMDVASKQEQAQLRSYISSMAGAQRKLRG